MFRIPSRRAVVWLLGAVALGSVTIWGLDEWSYQTQLGRAEREVASGSYAQARASLIPLARRRPGRAEIEYPLGICEASLGHVDAALDGWARVPPTSRLAPRAALERARLAIAHGRLAAAESSLATISDGPGALAEQAVRLALQLDLFSGRGYRIPGRIERHWKWAGNQANQLHTHWLYETQAFPEQEVRDALVRMGRNAPDDDRVWLGKADIATRAGRFEEAARWLDACEARRRRDPDVRHARLAWALDARRADVAERTLSLLPADRYTPAEIALLSARMAELRGRPEEARRALERRVELEPGDSVAWARLAELALRAPAEGSDLRARARRRKAELDRGNDEYRALMGRIPLGDLTHMAELARAAETLGRRFEARGWWSLLLRTAADDREARAALERLARDTTQARLDLPPGATLADLIPTAGTPATESSPAQELPDSRVVFRDDAEVAGLHFVYENDQSPLRRLPETMGGGLGLLDYDDDGHLDVYAVQGGRFPPGSGSSKSGGDRLFRNKGDGTFEDVTERSGIGAFRRGYGHGVVVGDVDNDGHADLFVTRWRSYALYRNRGDGTFEDATERLGPGGERGWPTSSALADLDGDGDLDLYVCHYLDWDPERSPPCPDPAHPGRNSYCVPRAFEAERDHLFRNDGHRFVDVTESAGIVDRDGRGLGVVAADLDGDGRCDLYVANDMTANFLFRNLGGMRFEEIGITSGAGSNSVGGYQAGMGIACGDLDGDGLPDLVVTNFYGESVTLYQNLGRGMFADRTAAAGLAAPTRFVLGFGTSFLDADSDGLLDLAFANGHVNDSRPAIPYAMPAQLFLGAGQGRMVDASARAGACWAMPRVGRGLAVGDLDNDGRPDVLLLSQASPLAYHHNLSPGGHFLTLALRGTSSNRDAVGAVVRVSCAGRTQTAWRLGGGSFLSSNDPRLHFGLGARVAGPPRASVEVQWPSGRVDRYSDLPVDAAYSLTEGDSTPRPLRGWHPAQERLPVTSPPAAYGRKASRS